MVKMNLEDRNDREKIGMEMKACFNKMFDETMKGDPNNLTYGFMRNISDRMANLSSHPKFAKYGLKTLPPQVTAALQFAVAITDPNKESQRDNLKKAFSLCSGVGGASLAVICLGTILNPGILATVAAFFVGGVAFPVAAPVGVIAGIAIIGASIYAAMRKMTGNERAIKCNEIVIKGIDKWIEDGHSE